MAPVDVDDFVAAGPRFLKCYDINHEVQAGYGVAAGPRFLKCYDCGAPVSPVDELQLDRDF